MGNRKSPAPRAGGNRASSSISTKVDLTLFAFAEQAKAGTWGKVPLAAAYDSRVAPAPLRVLVALSGYADASGYCFPAVGTLASRLGLSRRSVQRHIATLESLAYLVRSRRTRVDGRGGYASNGYSLLYPMPPAVIQEAAGYPSLSDQVRPPVAGEKLLEHPRCGNESDATVGVASVDCDLQNFPEPSSNARRSLDDNTGVIPGVNVELNGAMRQWVSHGDTTENVASDATVGVALTIPSLTAHSEPPKAARAQDQCNAIIDRLRTLNISAQFAWTFLMDFPSNQYGFLSGLSDTDLMQSVAAWQQKTNAESGR
ncbi:helix-turn-helix domain-containing protein [Ferrovibrio sp.]|uniref:helix-turn-helix domain-containing protein n=1 Tax=Ferrovibrio sp. TaxID=1917215 RepID=UPI0035AF2F42